MNSTSTKSFYTFALLLLAGLLLLLCIAPSEYFFVPRGLEVPARMVYRIAYFVVLPFRALVISFIPNLNHQWSVAHTVVVCLGAPFFYWAAIKAGLRLKRGRLKQAVASQTHPGSQSLPRRGFLANSLLGLGATAFAGGSGHALLWAPQRLQIRRYELPISDLPPALDGLKLIHVSDTHYGPFVSLSYLKRVVDEVNALEGDLVLLTGDYVHRTRKAIEPGIGIFANLTSRYGSIGVLGNHEHWVGAERCRQACARIGVPLVDNGRLFLNEQGFHTDAASKDSICVAGVGDLWEDEVSFDKAFSGVPDSMPRLLLSHNPDVAEDIGPGVRVDAQFSGHTHGGQVRLPVNYFYGTVTAYGDKYLGGLCSGPVSPVIVSRAIGLAGIPIRVGVDPEVGVITLRRA